MTEKYDKRRVTIFAILALAAGVIVLERCHTYSEPLERDITTYAVIGEELLKGRALYSDLWDHKPPAIHLTFAAAEALAGEGPAAVFLLNVLAALAVLAGLYQGGKILGGRAGGLWAAAIWAVVSSDLYLEANQPNVELFLNAFQAWIFVLWLTAKPGSLQFRRWVLIGALASVASLYKPFAFLEPLALSVAGLCKGWADPTLRKKALEQAIVVFSCVLASWAAVEGWFSATGRWEDFKTAIWTYNAGYIGYRAFFGGDWLVKIGELALPPTTLCWLLLLFALGCLGAFSGARKEGKRGTWLSWIAFLIVSELEVVSPGKFYPHYDQLLIPPLVLGAAGGLTAWAERIGKIPWKCLPGVILLAFLVFYEAPFYRLPPEEWTDRKYADGPLFIQAVRLGRELDGMLKPGETFYEWGNETGLYFAARRSPPSGIFYSYPLMDNPLAGELAGRVVGDLERQKPEVIVLNTRYLFGDLLQRHPILRWIRENYRPLPPNLQRNPFLLMALKGGRMEQRLARLKDGTLFLPGK